MSLGRLLPLVAMIALSGNAQAQEVVEDGQIKYLTGDPATWPSELEATVAAPDNHRNLLENDDVRVLEVTLGPGEVEPLHFHRWPSVLHILQADQWIDLGAEGKVIFDSREVPSLQYPLTLWKGPEAPHSPVNLSDSVTVKLIRVEVKPGPVLSAGTPDRVDGGSPIQVQAESEIRAAIAYWAEIYNRNDWSLLATQFTEDAVMMPPGSPAVTGRTAIAAWEKDNEDGYRITLRPDEISVAGDRAIVRGRSCVFIPLGSGGTGVDVGKFIEVRRRQSDGRWLVSHDAFNSDLPDGSDLAAECPTDISNDTRELVRDGDVSDQPGQAGGLDTILDNRTRVILEGIRSGDVSAIMALYGPGSLYSTDNTTLLSDLEAIEAFWVNVAASPAHDATLEVLRIEQLAPDAFVEIQKYDVFDAAGERMFGGYASLLWRKVGRRWIIAADVSN